MRAGFDRCGLRVTKRLRDKVVGTIDTAGVLSLTNWC